METQSQYKPEQIQEWQKANNMEVFSLTQLCALLMKFEERQNEIARYIQVPKMVKFELLPHDNVLEVNAEDLGGID